MCKIPRRLHDVTKFSGRLSNLSVIIIGMVSPNEEQPPYVLETPHISQRVQNDDVGEMENSTSTANFILLIFMFVYLDYAMGIQKSISLICEKLPV